MTLELLTVGRVSVDLYADAADAGWLDEQRFVKSIGGTATNVAVAAARLGRRSAVLTKVGADPFGGDYVVAKLEVVRGRHPFRRPPRVDADAARLRRLDASRGSPTRLLPRREGAYMQQPGDVDAATISGVGVLWIAGSAMGEEPARTTISGILSLRDRRAHTVLDLDYRAVLWPSEREATAVIGAAIDFATVAIGNREECRVAIGTEVPDQAADALLSRGVTIAAVKLGGDGVLVATADDRAVVALARSASSAASVPATRSAGRSCTACLPAGRLLESSSTPTPPGRSSPGG